MTQAPHQPGRGGISAYAKHLSLHSGIQDGTVQCCYWYCIISQLLVAGGWWLMADMLGVLISTHVQERKTLTRDRNLASLGTQE
jgi:hypothetical protein